MLLPNKNSHPDATVLAAAAQLLRTLRKRRAVPFDELRLELEKRVRSADYLFTPAVSLLFLLNLVEYRPKNDSFEYVGA